MTSSSTGSPNVISRYSAAINIRIRIRFQRECCVFVPQPKIPRSKLTMWHAQQFAILVFAIKLVPFTNAISPTKHSACKATPGSHDWPSESSWSKLNRTLSGRLIQPPAPGAVCYPGQPTFNAATCPAIQAEWLTAAFHTEDPVSSVQNNWNNDTCLPYANDTCSGKGYPVYVINATCAEDVKIGVDFARKNNVRLIV